MRSEDPNDYLRTHGRDSLRDLVDRAEPFASGHEAGDAFVMPRAWSWVDPAAIPARQWLYGRYLLRGTLSVTIAPGGVGKSALTIAESLALATGRALLGQTVIDGPHRAWYLNLEDPQDELDRRVAGACMHFGISQRDLGGRLFINSGIQTPVTLAELGAGGKVLLKEDLFAHLESEIIRHKIDAVIIDPFISAHDVSENDNMAIDRVAKRLIRMAAKCQCAIAVIHHTKKNGNQEIDAESSRGASALVSAARIARVLNGMTKEQAESAKIPAEARRAYFRTSLDKQNLAPPETDPNWYCIAGVDLGNGDSVGVPARWKFPDEFSGIDTSAIVRVLAIVAVGDYTESSQAGDWLGLAIGPALGLNPVDPADKRKISRLIKSWCASGALRTEVIRDSRQGRPRKYLRPGNRPQ